MGERLFQRTNDVEYGTLMLLDLKERGTAVVRVVTEVVGRGVTEMQFGVEIISSSLLENSRITPDLLGEGCLDDAAFNHQHLGDKSASMERILPLLGNLRVNIREIAFLIYAAGRTHVSASDRNRR